jgi:hypothetical protein
MLVEGLSLTKCVLESDAAAAMLADGIRVNRSLRKCEWFMELTDYIVLDTLKINQNLVRLGLTIEIDNGSNCLFEVFRSAKGSQTLQSLEIRESQQLNHHSMQAISLLCFTIKSFQELSFHKCSFYHGAMTFLIESLSNNKLINTLTLEQVTIFDSDDKLMTMSCGSVQVEKLNLSGTKFDLNSLLQTMKDTANMGCIKTFHLCDDKYNNDFVIRYVCDAFLRPNRGPSELIMGKLNANTILVLTAALQQNTSVKVLDIPQDLHLFDIVRFSQALANMGLRRLSLKSTNSYAGPVFRALQEGLEQNTTICQLCIDGDDSLQNVAPRCLDRIRFLLTTNLVGRHTLTTAPDVPAGLWAHVLAGSCDAADGIYFALREKPDIVLAANLV